MLLIQIVILVFVAFAVINIVSRFKKRYLNLNQTILWLIVWFGAAFVTIDPDASVFFAQLLGVTRGADLIIYFSLIILFYLLFMVQIKIERIERNITKIVQDRALKK